MKKTTNLTKCAIVIFIIVFAFSTSLLAQEGQSGTSQKAETEMKSTFGTVPAMMKVMPDHMRAGAWEWFKSTQDPDAAIPAKYSELIALGVASQVPCDYCIYAHTTMAKMLGATDAEIQEAVASAANTRHWSTILNGNDVSLEEFKKEWDGILAYLKTQSEGK
jgi:AhpD family alkylhydroperoxidase